MIDHNVAAAIFTPLDSVIHERIGDRVRLHINEGAWVAVHADTKKLHGVRIIEIVLAKEAQLQLFHEHDLEDAAYALTIHVTVHEQSVLHYYALYTASGFFDLVFDVRGPGAQVLCNGGYVLTENQKLKLTTKQLHEAPYSQSELIMKGALSGSAKATYNGAIYIGHKAHQTNAGQTNANLLLSPQACAESIPSLEVLTNDVQCRHGSAVGQLDEDQLLYMCARGMNPQQARSLLLNGYLSDIFLKIEDVAMRQRIIERIKVWCNGLR